jgi:oxygen-dependent protoporphyrinogen oxidase
MEASERNAVVVGAGLAGLAAAWELRKCGFRVTVLEREPQPGGRARSELVEGFTLEPLSPVLSTADRELLAWIAEVGAGDELLPLRPLVTAQVRRSRVSDLDVRGLLDFTRIPGVKRRQGLRLVRLPRLMRRYAARVDPDAPEKSAELDDRSLADFGKLYFGSSVLDYWMTPFVTSASLGDEYQTSRVHFLQRHRRVFGARLGLPRAPLRALLDGAAEKLPTLCDAEVVGVEPGRGGGLDVCYSREGRQHVLEACAVVLATPAPDAARLGRGVLTTGERELLERMRYTPSISLAAATCRPLSWHPREIRVPHAEHSPIETALVEPGMSGGRIPDGYGCVTLRATGSWSEQGFQRSEETLEKELLDALERFQPGVRAALNFTRVFRVERALPRFDVGHYRALARLSRVGEGRRAEGRRLYLAGDYRMDPSWNGALASGRRAAREAAADSA